MFDAAADCAIHLRQRAEWCRACAHGPIPAGIAQAYEAMARDYEEDAELLEHAQDRGARLPAP